MVVLLVFVFVFSDSAYGIAKESTLTLSVDDGALSISLLPSVSGNFGKSEEATIMVNTDNFTGYTLSITAKDSTSMVNTHNDEIESITTQINETAFSTSSSYNNKWGYKPSQYVTTSGGINTTVVNSDYLPAPSLSGDLLAVTSAANASNVDDEYTMSFGARIDTTLPTGNYSCTYVLTVLANSIVYNITYDDSTSGTSLGTASNMPSPNPQALQIDGGTPVADSHAALSSATPTLYNKIFGGWCTVATTLNSTSGDYECSGTTYAPQADYPIDQTVDGSNITLYAIWLKDPFPIVWSQMGKCVFTATQTGTSTYDGDVSGSECTKYAGDDYIDTEIALYSTDNYQKDYEVHFTMDTYDPAAQLESQATIFSDKLSTSTGGGSTRTAPYYGRAPGVTVRKSSSNGVEIKSTYGGSATASGKEETRSITKTPPATAFNGTDIRIFRIDGVIYTSVDNGPLVLLQDYTQFNQQFGLTAWFGAYPDNVDCSANCTAAKRFLTGELSNMYIKLGDMPASGTINITFDANGGTPNSTTYKIINGNALVELPEVTRSGWLFDGWWTASSGGQQISAATVPTATTTYYAHWYKSVSDAQITNTSVSLPVGDTETIIITNAADIEPYTLTSSDTSVATVDSSGVITAVSNGTATITLTGTKTGDTQTISVVVGTLISVDFDSQGGTPSTYTELITEGSSFSSLPEPTKPGHTFDGWYTGTNGTGDQLTTSTVFDANTPTQYYANWEEPTYVCKIATTLHSEQCLKSSGGCYAAGWTSPNNTLEYGYLIVDSSPVSAGAAYDCDVNSDGTYDYDTERFYYFGTENGNAKLIYHKNMSNNASVPYTDAIALLPNYELDTNNPSVPVWGNQYLVRHTTGDYTGKAARFMTYYEISNGLYAGGNNHITPSDHVSTYLFEQSNFTVTTRTDGIWIERQTDGQGNITYVNRIQTSSRTLTHGAVGATSANASRPTIDVPTQYLEPYTEPIPTHTITFNPHNGDNTFTETVTSGSALGNKYPSPDPTYADHIFQGWYTAASGGTLVTDQTVPDGDWTYHAHWKGTVALAQVANNAISVAMGNTATVNVTNAATLEGFTFSSSDANIASVDASTGVITGVAEGTATISITGTTSGVTNSNIVTVTVAHPASIYRVTFDPQNGDSVSTADIVIGEAIGSHMPHVNPTYTDHAFMRWYDTSNGNTVTSATTPSGDMTVYAEWKLDVTQAIISNELILGIGDEITISVNNSSQLEDYTFSSSDTTIATVDANTGVVTGEGAGTTSIIMTGTQSNLTKTIAVEVSSGPAVKHTVTFNANGGSTPTPSASFQVDDGDLVGSLPTTSRANYRFFGWYTDNGTFYNEVTPVTTVDADVTYYAKWVEDTTSFPIIWAETNACTFDGVHNVSGDYCASDNKTKKYIDTTKQLFTQANYEKDFEVGFTIVEYTPANNGHQATFVNSKQENKDNNYPGFVVRRYTSTDDTEITQKWKGDDGVSELIPASTIKTVKIVRRIEDVNGTDHIKMYYSINGGTLTPLQDITNVTHLFFDTTVWFGASASSSNTMQRPLVGTLTDMYIRLGVQTEYTIDFNPGAGSLTAGEESRTISIGSQVGQLPTPTPPSANYTFDAWYDESVSPAVAITSSTTPTSNKTYVAHYNYQSSNTPVMFDVSNNATRGYESLLDSWTASPVNIATFNQASPINNSTWGDTTELSELQFWNGIRDNFVNNNCLIKTNSSYNTNSDATKPLSALSAWTNGATDCSKPDAYDTMINAPLTVRLNNAQGAVVSYAKADNGVIYNMIPGQTYYWEKTSDSTIYGYVTATSNGSSTGTRWVDTGVIRNARDLGGLPVTYTDSNNQTVTGTLAYGRLFRGEKLQNAPTTELTNLGITTEYNVGDEYSSDTHLSDYHLNTVIHYNFDYNTGDESNPNSNYMKAWTAVTNIMTDITNANSPKNIYFHCRVGADRTGTVAYLLEGLLGVPDEQRYEEYGLTNLSGLYDRTRYYKEKIGGSVSPTMKFVYMMSYVRTNQQIYNWYMHGPNADANLIQAFRTAMVVRN